MGYVNLEDLICYFITSAVSLATQASFEGKLLLYRLLVNSCIEVSIYHKIHSL
jgi:hypothetical protein